MNVWISEKPFHKQEKVKGNKKPDWIWNKTRILSKGEAQLDKEGSCSDWINQEQLLESAQKSKMLQEETSH